MLDKKNKYLIVIIISFIILFIPKVNAITITDQFKKSFISGYSYVDSSGHYGNFEYFTRKSDGKIAYCIEPGVSLYNGTYTGFYDLSMIEIANTVNLSLEQLNKLSLIAYFGWGYNGHYGYEWIVATQSLIWDEIGLEFQYTSKNNPSNPWKYVISTPIGVQEKMEEIKKLIDKYLEKPNFPTHIKIGINDQYILNTIQSLENYSISSCINCSAYLNENQLIIRPTTDQDGSIHLIKKIQDWDTSFIVYEHKSGQNMIVPGNLQSLETDITFEIVTGELELKKYDQDVKTCTPKNGGSLAGSIYHLYNNDGTYINDLVIDDNCNAKITNLELGTYYIQEYKAGLNYELDPSKYYFEVSIDQPKKENCIV